VLNKSWGVFTYTQSRKAIKVTYSLYSDAVTSRSLKRPLPLLGVFAASGLTIFQVDTENLLRASLPRSPLLIYISARKSPFSPGVPFPALWPPQLARLLHQNRMFCKYVFSPSDLNLQNRFRAAYLPLILFPVTV
jgi:hypothetical protein